jgi:hypothetical protein
VSPVLDYFSSLFRREDWHIAATATPVSLLEEHKQPIAQRRIAVDGTTTSSNVNPNACDAPDQSNGHIEASRGSHEGFYGSIALPSLAEIGVIDAMAARLALVERLESVYTAATALELPQRPILTKKSPYHVVLTTQRFAPKTETSFPSTLLAPMGKTLVFCCCSLRWMRRRLF